MRLVNALVLGNIFSANIARSHICKK